MKLLFLYGISNWKRNITLIDSTETNLDFILRENNTLDEVVITGTLKPVSRLESPVPVEVYKPSFFKKNPTTNIFEALQNVNGFDLN
jgi:outer membrane receptor for ferrienterochelin and colicins